MTFEVGTSSQWQEEVPLLNLPSLLKHCCGRAEITAPSGHEIITLPRVDTAACNHLKWSQNLAVPAQSHDGHMTSEQSKKLTSDSDTELLIILLQFGKQCNHVWSSAPMLGILLQTSLEIPFSKNCYLQIKKYVMWKTVVLYPLALVCKRDQDYKMFVEQNMKCILLIALYQGYSAGNYTACKIISKQKTLSATWRKHRGFPVL